MLLLSATTTGCDKKCACTYFRNTSSVKAVKLDISESACEEEDAKVRAASIGHCEFKTVSAVAPTDPAEW
jgi:hypothetical protein